MTRLLTTDEAAELLRVSERTIRRWANTGRIPSIRFGKPILIPRDDLFRANTGQNGPKHPNPYRTPAAR